MGILMPDIFDKLAQQSQPATATATAAPAAGDIFDQLKANGGNLITPTPAPVPEPEQLLFQKHPANLEYKNIRERETPAKIVERQTAAKNVAEGTKDVGE